MQYIIGIDPGASGAIAILDGSGKLVRVFDMPIIEVQVGKATKRRVAPYFLQDELQLYANEGARAVVEQVGAMPGQGVSSMFAFGEAFGLVKGVLAGMRITTATVTPAKWKKDLKVNASKDGSRALAANLWPDMAGEFKRVKDDGRAEAALIAHWGITELR